ncbi:flagellar assembly protein FliH [Myxococcus sp. CA051A]|uniref:Flagellar assembly protein FliH n=1 Tax=Myxococcus llanfairpwllgwyngyllgogerychwyrndrobwllllantysiliogogogochensis TaxID=2590453 RepID=A0A540WP19_9BACT|nr:MULTISPECIES: flagellar assembly protein FliH [Myxococcus]NTX13090.1 flagellar assembly protein FliH [Myxococcus sp. CA056]NTX36458.1 flagellar assembly protein FliH [Myxococcus sp. CA033]NTX56745.1 flagellar assembly protein FliH [Myxococcus sp. CA039A]NTX64766.1 flagellar assembly protein FliH [Myxococcus sp. CA051A]TQF10768.1 flagellar assembly protein FliH [Myxococcus llanfairpwllgwyngyllgogerychwyrndrobwllllantysiliogogogochensis]
MPPYRLQTLLDMRTRAKEEAEQAFSDAIKALEREKVELQRLIDELERRKRERKEKVAAYLKEVMAKGAGINGMNMMGRFEERLKDEEAQVALEVERQREAVKVAERLVEQRRREMAEAAKELKAIEKHKETWQKQVKHERQQREELSQEEIGNALFLARQRK